MANPSLTISGVSSLHPLAEAVILDTAAGTTAAYGGVPVERDFPATAGVTLPTSDFFPADGAHGHVVIDLRQDIELAAIVNSNAREVRPSLAIRAAGVSPWQANRALLNADAVDQVLNCYKTLLKGQKIAGVKGIVSHIKGTGFYIEIPGKNPGDQVRTIYIYTKQIPKDSIPNLVEGAEVDVSGLISPFRGMDERDASNLEVPQISSFPDQIKVLSQGQALAETFVIGKDGQMPPAAVMSSETLQLMKDSGATDIEHQSVPYAPERDALAWWHKLIGRNVLLRNARVVAASDDRKYFYVVPENGDLLDAKSANGAPLMTEKGPSPQLIRVDVAALPKELRHTVTVGDRIKADLEGIVEYSFGRFQLRLSKPFEVIPGGLQPAVTKLKGDKNNMSVGVANVENLNPTKPDRIRAIAEMIAVNLNGPDVVALQEIQDNDGDKDSGTVDGKQTLEALIAAIREFDPNLDYEFVQIDPVNADDGGQPGANIRVGYLVNKNRVSFKTYGNAGPKTEAQIGSDNGEVKLGANPARIGTENEAFTGTRKSLLLEVEFNGEKVFLINNHFSSKRGDSNHWGIYQPPRLHSEDRRLQQATFVRESVVDRILKIKPDAKIVVVGDMNEHSFRPPMKQGFEGNGNLVLLSSPLLMSAALAYDYSFSGHAQDLGPFYGSPALIVSAGEFVHANSEFPSTRNNVAEAGGRPGESKVFYQRTDHDPSVFLVKIESRGS